MARTLALTAFLLALATTAWAQSPAPAPAPPPPPPALEGSAEAAFVSTTGNSSTQSFGIAGDVTSRPAPWVLRFKSGYIRNEAEDVLTAESFFFLGRAARQLSPRLSAYGQYDYLRNLFAGIEHRNSLEGGLSFLAVDNTVHRLRLDAGLGYANEQRSVGDALSTALATFGAGYRLRLSETAEFTDEGRFALSLSEGEDWRFENVAAVTARLTGIFSLKVSNTIRYVNAPVPTFEKTDTVTSVALVAKFARP
jgi:putative salt-induced outer membrane protein YdiY